MNALVDPLPFVPATWMGRRRSNSEGFVISQLALSLFLRHPPHNASIILLHLLDDMTRAARLSGLQRDVLALYRQCLRAARKKPAQTRGNFETFARREFEKNIHMDKKDFGAIEFMLRKGTRQLETYEAPNITNIAG